MNNVVAELGSEKIDIIKYSDDPAEYVAAALSPADVVSVLPLRARAAGWWCRTTSLPGHRQGGAKCPAGRQAHRLQD